MRIICDAHIPFVCEAVQREWPEVDICPMEPDQIDASAIHNADVLIIRTRTKVNKQLLANSSVQLVCTATIGYDHIDTAYCDDTGIRWISCPGCNAQAVCDYIEEAIEESSNPPTIGIVGVGHVGSLVAKMAERKGLKVLLNDPPKGIGVSLDKIARICDIITFHVPLVEDTYHLCDAHFLSLCKPGALIINAARGGVVDEEALLHSGHPFILDTWENEPAINPAVLSHAFRASMHIAGYSIEGKRNASQMCLDAVAEQFNLTRINITKYPFTDPSGNNGDTSPGWLSRISDTLKADPASFEHLRKIYSLR